MALTKAQLVDLNANELIIDLDADTSITADTDDQIDIKIAGADDFRFTANTFTALSGSTIAAQALTATTLTTTGAIAIANDGNIGSAGDADAIAISSSGVVTFSQTPVLSGASLTAGTTPLTTLDIDGGTDIGAAIADADLFIIDDGAGGTNRKVTASRVKTYMGAEGGAFSLDNLDIDGATDIGADIVDADLFIIDDGAGGTNRKVAASRIKTYIGASTAADDLTIGDAAVTLSTSSGNITIDATANDTDIIFKGTDGGADITMLTLDGSGAGAATFNNKKEDAFVQFRIKFEKKNDNELISIINNIGYEENVIAYGVYHTGAQRLIGKEIWQKFCPKYNRYAVITKTHINKIGQASNSSISSSKGMPANKKCINSIIDTLNSSNYIPAFVNDNYVPSTYVEVFGN